jgi:hypothetical protein
MHTGLYPFNLELVIQKFTKKIDSRPSSSESGASIIPAEDWRRLDKLIKAAVRDIYDEKAIQLRETVSHFSTYTILLQDKIGGLERALINARKRPNNPLLLGLSSEQDGGALFMSPSKVQQARDGISQKDEQARKDDEKLQRRLAKQAKETKKAEKAQIRQEKRIQRKQETAEKQRLKDEQELAKLADLQLQVAPKKKKFQGKQSQKRSLRPIRRIIRWLRLETAGAARYDSQRVFETNFYVYSIPYSSFSATPRIYYVKLQYILYSKPLKSVMR